MARPHQAHPNCQHLLQEEARSCLSLNSDKPQLGCCRDLSYPARGYIQPQDSL